MQRVRRTHELAGKLHAPLGVLTLALAACGGVQPPPGPVEDKTGLKSSTASLRGISEQANLEPLGTALGRPAAAFGMGVFLVVWADTRPGGIYGARVQPDGDVLDPGGFRINPEGASFSSSPPNVAFDGERFVVIWNETADGVFGVHVAPDGEVSEKFTVLYSGEVRRRERPGLDCGPGVCLAAYTVTADVGEQIYVSRIFPNGETDSSPTSISPSDVSAREPDVAWGEDHFLVVWTDGRLDEEDPDIFGNRILPDRAALDGRGFPIVTEEGTQQQPAVTWTGERFLAVWEDDRNGDFDIFGARVEPDGDVKEEDGFPIAVADGEQRFPDLAHKGYRSLVVWDDTRSGDHRVRGAEVEEDGDVLDGRGFRISRGLFSDEFLPAVARGEKSFFVAFAGADGFSLTGSNDIFGTRVKHDQEVKDVPALLLTGEPN